MATGVKRAFEFILSPGNSHDAPQGRLLMETVGKQKEVKPLIMDKAYEDDETWFIATSLGFSPVVPPKSNRKTRGSTIKSFTKCEMK